MNNPVATYRIQFHSAFTFTDFERVMNYLQKLGVSTIYASPVFEAAPGSTHGYDSVDPHRINPEVGNLQQLKTISAKLKDQNIGWLQDIVPNHMGFHQTNKWLMDVLEKGKRSLYASFFDAAWTSPLFKDEPIMVPFLGNPLDDVIANNELSLAYMPQQGLVLQYYDNWYPLNPASYQSVLTATEQAPKVVQQWINKVRNLLQVTDAGSFALQWAARKQKLFNNLKDEEFKGYFDRCIKTLNGDTEKLTRLSEQQAYRLCSWQETDAKINYRRFFTVNSLICLNMQDEAVFDHFHRQIKTLVDEGIFRGLRIDHIDGLHNPSLYLEQLRELAGQDTYIVAEKILEEGEELPAQWPIQGTSGYDFLAQVNNLLTNSSASKKFIRFYQELTGSGEPVQEQIWTKKTHILKEHMGGELENLYQLLRKLKLTDKKILAGITAEDLKDAIGQLLIHCPVYRYYGNQFPLQTEEYDAVKALFSLTKKNKPNLKPALNLLEIILLEKPKLGNADYNKRALQFYQRLMQFSGPLMAKGVEDTLMYTYNCFIGHNEVGDAPDAFGMSIKQFHKFMVKRQQQWPLAINGTSTHDTKRGEDVRARLNVLTDMPKKWLKTVSQWRELNAGLRQGNGPDVNDEYFIYQTITGAYPMPGQDEDNFPERIKEYLTKALREAKTNSNWTTPNEAYEQETLGFAAALLDRDGGFWPVFEKFQQTIADYGIVNSLAQVLLKFTCPGVPDVYQGCEMWDLSLVDPDNRRPVDYALRSRLSDDLDSIKEPTELIDQLWQNRYNGQIKLWLTRQLFAARRQDAALFAEATYLPLQVKGAYKDYIIAFARRYQRTWHITIAPLHIGELSRDLNTRVTEIDWKNTRILLPAEAPSQWTDQLSGTTGTASEGIIRMKDIFTPLPLALLKLEHAENTRGAGILMPITSLPSPFGIGDIGPEAKKFADFLSRSGQKYWQLLPLNPTGPEQNYSPYSSVSSMAGNPMLISPEAMVEIGLLTADDLAAYQLPEKSKVNYNEAQRVKELLFEQAYQNFKNGVSAQTLQYKQFCKEEAFWLDDFALYIALKHHHENKPWYEWPEDFKTRRPAALKKYAGNYTHELDKVKWQQFIFFRQWASLREHCTGLNIQLFGDLPFYVSHDSADVWANKDNFALDADGQMTGIAGVPPDYFSADGQLWGMPVYRWDVMKARGYNWWISRLRKNMQLFDLLRLDHFRAFSAYWEVPAGEETAKNGRWRQGPGSDFFKAVENALGSVPFVAEDLGDIDEPVFALRNEFDMPGMKVLQFAFGDTLPESLYIPHNYQENYIVYTGTHDNNTTVGWYNQDTNKSIRKQLEQYTGTTVKAKNVHLVLGRATYASTAKIAILPMQDVIGLDENSRINNPSASNGNWLWRLRSKELNTEIQDRLREWVMLYNRL